MDCWNQFEDITLNSGGEHFSDFLFFFVFYRLCGMYIVYVYLLVKVCICLQVAGS